MMTAKETQAREAAEAELNERRRTFDIMVGEEFTELMSTRPFRRFVWLLMADCLVFNPIFDTDQAVMYLREGKRQIGLNLLAKIQMHCPELYQTMANENATNP